MCRGDGSHFVLGGPVVRGGVGVPDTPPGPSLENPLESLFPVVVPAAARSGGGRAGQAAAAASAPPGASDSAGRGCAPSARPPPGLALHTSGATRWHPVPRRRVCAGAGLGLLPSLGGRVAPASRDGGSLLELPVWRREKPLGSPRRWEATPQSSSDAAGVLCPPRSWPFCPDCGQGPKTPESTPRQRRPASRFPPAVVCLVSEGGRVWSEARTPAAPGRPGPRPQSPAQGVGRSSGPGSADGLQQGSADGMGGVGEGERPGSSPGAPAGPFWETSRGASHSLSWPLRGAAGEWRPSRDSQGLQPGPLPPTRDIPSPTGKPRRRVVRRAFDAARSPPASDPAPGAAEGKQRRTGAPRGLGGPRRGAMLSR